MAEYGDFTKTDLCAVTEDMRHLNKIASDPLITPCTWVLFEDMFKGDVNIQAGGITWVANSDGNPVTESLELRDLRAEVLTLRARVAELESAARPA